MVGEPNAGESELAGVFAVNPLNAWPFGEFKKFTSSQKLIVIC